MEIFIRLKTLGKGRKALEPRPYFIPEGVSTLTELLTAIVKKESSEYNRKMPDQQIIDFLTEPELDAMAETGKVGFGRIFSHKKANMTKAVANALHCWDDGLIKVFMDETEIEDRHAPLDLSEGTVFTFMRLSFLSGSIW